MSNTKTNQTNQYNSVNELREDIYNIDVIEYDEINVNKNNISINKIDFDWEYEDGYFNRFNRRKMKSFKGIDRRILYYLLDENYIDLQVKDYCINTYHFSDYIKSKTLKLLYPLSLICAIFCIILLFIYSLTKLALIYSCVFSILLLFLLFDSSFF